ncbi:hypothetical protein TNIN_305261 [Trichonephila inaurata madagascariensis]|uniref:Uncharacterized protein n=1 Tax=Trichonephila inaurata madagascariensis TaxID=2747483 RepID=A0A8X7CL22_9ARAC|nr:hypothetical protein TNIN_305261 [Trichonephila inaurata madagascariensis]
MLLLILVLWGAAESLTPDTRTVRQIIRKCVVRRPASAPVALLEDRVRDVNIFKATEKQPEEFLITAVGMEKFLYSEVSIDYSDQEVNSKLTDVTPVMDIGHSVKRQFQTTTTLSYFDGTSYQREEESAI